MSGIGPAADLKQRTNFGLADVGDDRQPDALGVGIDRLTVRLAGRGARWAKVRVSASLGQRRRAIGCSRNPIGRVLVRSRCRPADRLALRLHECPGTLGRSSSAARAMLEGIFSIFLSVRLRCGGGKAGRVSMIHSACAIADRSRARSVDYHLTAIGIFSPRTPPPCS